MAKRTMTTGFQSIAATGTPQPLLGQALTAAVLPSTNPVNVAVGNSADFQVGDWAILFDNSGPSLVQEAVLVMAIVDSTHVKVGHSGDVIAPGITGNYTTSGWLIQASKCNSVYIQTKKGNAADIWIGTNASMSSATGAYCYADLTAVLSGQPIELTAQEQVGQYPDTPANFWVEGTAGDKYLVTLGLV